MRVQSTLALAALSLCSTCLGAGWTFEDATLTVSSKGGEVGGQVKEKLTPSSALTSTSISLGPADSLKIVLTTTEGKTAKRAHQAFLTLHEPVTGLEESFQFSLKENGKGKVEVTQKDLPYQFITSDKPLKASFVIASFGSATPYKEHAFDLSIEADQSAPPAAPSPAERYTSKPEIHHQFKDDPRSPPRIISLLFTLAVLATVPVLLGTWLFLGANVDHLGKAFGANPVAHGLFFGSIIAMEGVFFMYYTVWNLFQTLPVAVVIAVVAYVSGSRALTEVQDRRLAGER
ncbi:hypothetical protein LTR62_006135 [Meristemomyces frigidus]|uniref:Ribophorin II C-terminal domain-containing protein n=1 Tax=Meristemomyces frigidus TaxID=1508187 RepID=A0AAN7TNT4_9PEZI|nr:hypothetical protein LTR62_006135 [Meristemomyces frigidus]